MSHMQVQPIMDRVVCAVVEKDQKKKACVSGPAQFTLVLVKGQLYFENSPALCQGLVKQR